MYKNPRLTLFLTSFLILFLELALIRFLPAQVYYLGYYTNFILIASFVGIGGGILLARKKRDFGWFFPWALLVLIITSTLLVITVVPDQSGEIHIVSSVSPTTLPETVVVPTIFALVAAIFVFLSQKLGKLLNSFPPLTAYSLDILGSLSGILAFTVLTFLRTSPLLWFVVISALFLVIFFERSSRWSISLIALALIVLVVASAVGNSIWSPYQKITVAPAYQDDNPAAGQIGDNVFVNNILHQIMFFDPHDITSIYLAPYVLFKHPQYGQALIVGAGTGNDVVLALSQGVAHIDAVEIDPVIYELGAKLNPNRPYDDPRVSVTIDDGRPFLERTDKKYDLIVFALTDSLVLASGNSTLRLESFLLTQNSIQSAKNHLNSGGLLVMYNVYRAESILARLSSMTEQVFGRSSFVGYEPVLYRGVVMNGDKLSDLKSPMPVNLLSHDLPPATDDWPFLYLPNKTIPVAYLKMLSAIGLFTVGLIWAITRRSPLTTIEPTYFFLGAAFLLLETRSLIQFSLLFGNTWLVNALVFFAILSLVLGAVIVASKIKITRPGPWYFALFTALLIQYLTPASVLLNLTPVAKYLTVSLLTLTPVFIANVIFAVTFKRSQDNSNNFSSNLLGAAAGGALEYTALILGYKQLILVVMLCYFLAFVMPPPGAKRFSR